MRNFVKSTLFASSILAIAVSGIANAGTLENLERERALTIETLLNPDITPEIRQEKIIASKHRLIDLERMVIRDPALKGSNAPIVRVAFENYDLTFLAHAAVENQINMTDQWLEQIGVTSASLMNARVGKR